MINDVKQYDTYAAILINTRQGVIEALLDKEDIHKAEQITRFVLYKDPKYRPMARATKEDGQVLLHRLLFDIPKGSKPVWLNENTLDNRKANIALIDKDGNQTLLVPEKNELPKGVTFHKASQKWTSRPYWKGDRYSLGYFKKLEDAIAETNVFHREGPNSPKLKRNQ